MITNKETKNIAKPASEKKSLLAECCTSFGLISIILLILGVLVGITLFVVYMIIGLSETSNRDIQETCSDNNLWTSMLASFIIVSLSTSNTAKSQYETQKSEQNISVYLCSLIINTTCLIWIYNNLFTDCIHENFHDTTLYTIANIQFYTYFIVTFIYTVIISVTLIILCYVSCCPSKTLKNQSELENSII